MTRHVRQYERGFTLAGLLIILTVMAIVLAYTVPRIWSDVMRRERDIQTIWVMKQYARAIAEYQRFRGVYPTSLEQLKEQKLPRIIRDLYVCPLTGELDWELVPFGTVRGAPGAPGGPKPGRNPLDPRPKLGEESKKPGGKRNGPEREIPGGGAHAGPFIGVRPRMSGPSFVSFKGAENYEDWLYTITDIQEESGVVKRPQLGYPGMPGGGGNPPTP